VLVWFDIEHGGDPTEPLAISAILMKNCKNYKFSISSKVGNLNPSVTSTH